MDHAAAGGPAREAIQLQAVLTNLGSAPNAHYLLLSSRSSTPGTSLSNAVKLMRLWVNKVVRALGNAFLTSPLLTIQDPPKTHHPYNRGRQKHGRRYQGHDPVFSIKAEGQDDSAHSSEKERNRGHPGTELADARAHATWSTNSRARVSRDSRFSFMGFRSSAGTSRASMFLRSLAISSSSSRAILKNASGSFTLCRS